MAKVHEARPGSVAWVDLQTPDLPRARQFYSELLGWSFVGGDNPQHMYYTMARMQGIDVAGLMQSERRGGDGHPSAWNVYLATDDVDATLAKVTAAGGTLLMGPHEVMGEGRMAFFLDPTGAVFAVWQNLKRGAARLVGEPGATAWHELYTRDAAAACAFFGAVFGVEARRIDAPDMEYWTLHVGDDAIGGVMQMGGSMPPGVPPHWTTYFAVANVGAAALRLVALGGEVLQPAFDSPYGRICPAADPFGAEFCLIQMPETC